MKRKGKSQYTYEFKLKCVKLCLEEGYPRKFVAAESGANLKSLGAWIKRYNEEGPQGLKPQPKGKKGHQQVHPETKEKIIELKKQYPIFGIKRISDLLKRVFFLKASPETVRKTLHEEKLIQRDQSKPRKNPQKPRFFERTRPNQMWQTDIFSFRLGGQAAYLLAFIDDYFVDPNNNSEQSEDSAEIILKCLFEGYENEFGEAFEKLREKLEKESEQILIKYV